MGFSASNGGGCAYSAVSGGAYTPTLDINIGSSANTNAAAFYIKCGTAVSPAASITATKKSGPDAISTFTMANPLAVASTLSGSITVTQYSGASLWGTVFPYFEDGTANRLKVKLSAASVEQTVVTLSFTDTNGGCLFSDSDSGTFTTTMDVACTSSGCTDGLYVKCPTPTATGTKIVATQKSGINRYSAFTAAKLMPVADTVAGKMEIGCDACGDLKSVLKDTVWRIRVDLTGDGVTINALDVTNFVVSLVDYSGAGVQGCQLCTDMQGNGCSTTRETPITFDPAAGGTAAFRNNVAIMKCTVGRMQDATIRVTQGAGTLGGTNRYLTTDQGPLPVATTHTGTVVAFKAGCDGTSAPDCMWKDGDPLTQNTENQLDVWVDQASIGPTVFTIGVDTVDGGCSFATAAGGTYASTQVVTFLDTKDKGPAVWIKCTLITGGTKPRITLKYGSTDHSASEPSSGINIYATYDSTYHSTVASYVTTLVNQMPVLAGAGPGTATVVQQAGSAAIWTNDPGILISTPKQLIVALNPGSTGTTVMTVGRSTANGACVFSATSSGDYTDTLDVSFSAGDSSKDTAWIKCTTAVETGPKITIAKKSGSKTYTYTPSATAISVAATLTGTMTVTKKSGGGLWATGDSFSKDDEKEILVTLSEASVGITTVRMSRSSNDGVCQFATNQGGSYVDTLDLAVDRGQTLASNCWVKCTSIHSVGPSIIATIRSGVNRYNAYQAPSRMPVSAAVSGTATVVQQAGSAAIWTNDPGILISTPKQLIVALNPGSTGTTVMTVGRSTANGACVFSATSSGDYTDTLDVSFSAGDSSKDTAWIKCTTAVETGPKITIAKKSGSKTYTYTPSATAISVAATLAGTMTVTQSMPEAALWMTSAPIAVDVASQLKLKLIPAPTGSNQIVTMGMSGTEGGCMFAFTHGGAYSVNKDVSIIGQSSVNGLWIRCTAAIDTGAQITATHKTGVNVYGTFTASDAMSVSTGVTTCGVGKGKSNTAVQFAICENCPGGRFSASTDDQPCAAWQTSTCSAGSGFAAGSTKADATCSACIGNTFSAASNDGPCALFSQSQCGLGSGFGPGSASADSTCSVCATGKFNGANDATACKAHAFSACSPGNQISPDSNTQDRSCVPCLLGQFSLGRASDTCTAYTVTACSAGTEIRPGSAKADAVCASCPNGKYSSATDANACSLKTISQCASGKGYDKGSDTADDAACTNCAAGKYSGSYDDQPCVVHSLSFCPAGKNISPGTIKANDASCVACAEGRYSRSDSSKPCAAYTTTTCGTGTYWVKGSASADAYCSKCRVGYYSDTDDEKPCKAKTVTRCFPGKGFAESGTKSDGTCIACPSGKFSRSNDGYPCVAHNAATVTCGAGQGIAKGTAKADIGCESCPGGRFSDAFDDAGLWPCTVHTDTDCGQGQGVKAGTANTDTSCVACAAGMFSAAFDGNACALHNEAKKSAGCGADEKLQEGTSTADHSCVAAAAYTTTTTTPAPTGPPAKEVLDEIKKETETINKDLDSLKDLLTPTGNGGAGGGGGADGGAGGGDGGGDGGGTGGAVTPVSPAKEKQMKEIRKKIVDGLKAVMKKGSDASTSVKDLDKATPEEKQATVDNAIDTLAVVTGNSSQIDPDTASDVVETLKSVTTLAKNIKVFFPPAAQKKVIESLSSALNARGTAAPNDVMRSIPDIIDSVVATGGGGVGTMVEIKTEQIAVRSVAAAPAAATGQFITAYAAPPAPTTTTGSGGAGTPTAPNELDAPVRMALPSTLGFGGDDTGGSAGGGGGGGSVKTTLVQYNAATHPFRSAEDAIRGGRSTDITSIRMDYQGTAASSRRALGSEVGTVPGSWAFSEAWTPPDDWSGWVSGVHGYAAGCGAGSAAAWRRRRQSRRRLVEGQTGVDGVDTAPLFINLSFAIKSRLFNPEDELLDMSERDKADTQKDTEEMQARTVTYQTTDACGHNQTIEARTAVMPRKALEAGGADADPDMWCAWWSSDDKAWKTDGCSVTNVTNEVAVHCLCIIKQPTRSVFHGDFGIVDYAFSRIAKSFDLTTPFQASLASTLVCTIPVIIFILLIFRAKMLKCINAKENRRAEVESTKVAEARKLSLYHPNHLFKAAAKLVLRKKAGNITLAVKNLDVPVTNPMHPPNKSATLDENDGDDAAAVELGMTGVTGVPEVTGGKKAKSRKRAQLKLKTKRTSEQKLTKLPVKGWAWDTVDKNGHRRRSTLTRHNANLCADGKLAQEKVNPLMKGMFGVTLQKFDSSILEDRALSLHGAQSFCLTFWGAVKLNHDLLAPFLAPYELGKGDEYYAAMFLAKYMAAIASGTCLYHLHTCFKWGDLLDERQAGTSNLSSVSWWGGKALLVVMSLVLQKIPMVGVQVLFKAERDRRRKRLAGRGSTCSLGPLAWLSWVVMVSLCFAVTFVLTSKGFLESGKSEDEGGVPCGCQGLRTSKDVESEWLWLLLVIVLMRVLVVRPAQILTIVVLQYKRAKHELRIGKRPHSTKHLPANVPDPKMFEMTPRNKKLAGGNLVWGQDAEGGAAHAAGAAGASGLTIQVERKEGEVDLDELRLDMADSPTGTMPAGGAKERESTQCTRTANTPGGTEFEFGVHHELAHITRSGSFSFSGSIPGAGWGVDGADGADGAGASILNAMEALSEGSQDDSHLCDTDDGGSSHVYSDDEGKDGGGGGEAASAVSTASAATAAATTVATTAATGGVEWAAAMGGGNGGDDDTSDFVELAVEVSTAIVVQKKQKPLVAKRGSVVADDDSSDFVDDGAVPE